jgi:hypothetical protein
MELYKILDRKQTKMTDKWREANGIDLSVTVPPTIFHRKQYYAPPPSPNTDKIIIKN